MFREFYEYTANLLVAQHKVSDVITHPVIKGEVREHFLKEIIEKTFPDDIKFHRGLIAYDQTDQNQIDLFIKRKGAQTMNFGNHICIHPDDCIMMIEVKSSATGSDLKDFNLRAKKIKEQCETNKPPVCGLFCYKMALEKITALERFGYHYDDESVMYLQDEELILQYPYIDFFVCIDQSPYPDFTGTNEFFLRKDTSLTSTGGYDLSENFPAIKDFLRMMQGIIKTADNHFGR